MGMAVRRLRAMRCVPRPGCQHRGCLRACGRCACFRAQCDKYARTRVARCSRTVSSCQRRASRPRLRAVPLRISVASVLRPGPAPASSSRAADCAECCNCVACMPLCSSAASSSRSTEPTGAAAPSSRESCVAASGKAPGPASAASALGGQAAERAEDAELGSGCPAAGGQLRSNGSGPRTKTCNSTSPATVASLSTTAASTRARDTGRG